MEAEIIPPDVTAKNSDRSKVGYANLKPFQKGISGNPGGRPKAEKDVKAFALKNTKRAMERIVELIEDEDPRVALMAAKEVLDRAYGKPKVADDDDANDKKHVTINIIRHADRDQPAEQVGTTTVSVRTLALS